VIGEFGDDCEIVADQQQRIAGFAACGNANASTNATDAVRCGATRRGMNPEMRMLMLDRWSYSIAAGLSQPGLLERHQHGQLLKPVVKSRIALHEREPTAGTDRLP